MLAVGGVNEKNAADFLRAGCVGIGVGGNLVNADWINEGAFDRIEALARAYVEAVNV
jgi:2-dehydro-3-deoxyphosphogluconate aldolase/(4S)-4-hydroxy-2-oxoglutarate aldolase